MIPNKPYTIITGTPVVIRVKKESFEELNIVEKIFKHFY